MTEGGDAAAVGTVVVCRVAKQYFIKFYYTFVFFQFKFNLNLGFFTFFPFITLPLKKKKVNLVFKTDAKKVASF